MLAGTTKESRLCSSSRMTIISAKFEYLPRSYLIGPFRDYRLCQIAAPQRELSHCFAQVADGRATRTDVHDHEPQVSLPTASLLVPLRAHSLTTARSVGLIPRQFHSLRLRLPYPQQLLPVASIRSLALRSDKVIQIQSPARGEGPAAPSRYQPHSIAHFSVCLKGTAHKRKHARVHTHTHLFSTVSYSSVRSQLQIIPAHARVNVMAKIIRIHPPAPHPYLVSLSLFPRDLTTAGPARA
jgi:hypothetical protein